MTGGTMELYREVLVLFCEDAQQRLPLLKTVPDKERLNEFTTQIHALKSASGSIGAAKVSAEAEQLEAAGKSGDMQFIEKKLAGFALHLSDLVEAIKTALVCRDSRHGAEQDVQNESELIALLPLLDEFDIALKMHKANDIDRILDELQQIQADKNTRDAFKQISDHVLMAEYDDAGEILGEMLAKIKRMVNGIAQN